MSDVPLKHLQGRIYAALNSRVSLSANAAANEALLKLCARLSAVEAERDRLKALVIEAERTFPAIERAHAAEARVEAARKALPDMLAADLRVIGGFIDRIDQLNVEPADEVGAALQALVNVQYHIGAARAALAALPVPEQRK